MTSQSFTLHDLLIDTQRLPRRNYKSNDRYPQGLAFGTEKKASKYMLSSTEMMTVSQGHFANTIENFVHLGAEGDSHGQIMRSQRQLEKYSHQTQLGCEREVDPELDD